MKTLNSRNILSTAVSALMTMMVCSSVSRASDIEIYQNAKPSTITLMMLIDISGSMDYMSYGGQSACDAPNQSVKKYALQKINPHADAPTYRRQWCEVTSGGVTTQYPDRITRVKDGMMDLLFGNTSKGITALPDNNIIGLSTLGWVRNPLLIDPTESDGRLLWDGTQSSSPMRNQTNMNSLAYGKTGEYKSARGGSESDWDNIGNIAVPARRLDATITVDGVSITQRKYLAQKIASLAAVTNTPTARSYAETIAYLLGETTQGRASSGYNFANPDAYDTTRTGYYAAPSSMTQAEADKQCNGQGVYVLTDGDPYQHTNAQELIQSALGSTGSSFSCSTSDSSAGTWDCVRNLAKNYLLNGNNPKGVAIKTAVVGFGKNFNSVPSYDKTKSIADNVTSINASSASSNQKNAALWGVEGGGGWYSGSSSEDVVNSVKGFLNEIEVEIPAVATGSPTLPQDALNPLRIQPYGYYASFVPKPQESTQLWVGNMNKYHIFNGELYNASKTIRLIKADGSLDAAAKGLWTDEGMKGQLPLGIGTNAANEQVANRTIYTNREITGTAAPYAASEIGSLKKVNVATLFGTGSTALFVNDPDKNYWLNLLGYNVGATETGITLENLAAKPELRQVGAVMHSTPILLTQRGQIKYSSGTIDTTDRDDFLLFGSTQGLLHVVDADTGVEKFAFAPNEMMQRQKAAFLSETSSIGGSSSLFYGIDAPWTAYTQYVSKADGTLTVKNSDRNSDGGTNTDLALKGLQWVYGGLRMGGRSYYALDLSDLDKPSLKFHINPDAAVTAGEPDTSNALSYMGQSWSKPTLAYVKFGGVKKLVMFVGGGYDTGYETAAYDQNTNTTGSGAGVYMFDANNGNLLWWTSASATAAKGAEAFTDASASTVNMKYSVVSQINAIDRDNDGLADNLYFGDLGGQAFRIDLNNAATGADASAKKVNFAKRVVRLFNGNVSGGASPRFYEMPSVSIHEDNGYVAAVAFSSGNRSSPLVGTAVTGGNQAGSTVSAADGVFVVYDKDVARTDLYNTLPDTGATGLKTKNIALTSLNSNISTGVAVTGNNGWKYIYSNTAGVYKGMNELYAVDGMLYVNVYHRDGTGIGGSCGAGVKGDSYIYQFCLPTGKCSFATTNANTPNSVKLGAGILGAGLGQGFSNANNTGLIVKRPTTLDCATTPNLPECQEFTTTAKLRQLRWYETQ
ncbi:PilC/PilY family type IV pilus protein [Acinetobacter johnsonii]|uniref:PilC/PilY family type IV pilus protein n=1 Tax=Acinetobacter johnsonii TaxID=40214 RepID=UPI00244B2796|nr:PilC/PilY family type IV pilus protein [Acinetobacter johnsonii]MDH1068584.1 PilC/PilY family type IV pilus protein [Acinetobacter johnsonii]